MLLFSITEMIENKDLNRKDYVFFPIPQRLDRDRDSRLIATFRFIYACQARNAFWVCCDRRGSEVRVPGVWRISRSVYSRKVARSGHAAARSNPGCIVPRAFGVFPTRALGTALRRPTGGRTAAGRRWRRDASSCDDAGNPVKSPQCWRYPEGLQPFNLQACIRAAGSWASEQSGCKVAAEHQRNRGGFLATEPTGIGLTESAQAKALP